MYFCKWCDALVFVFSESIAIYTQHTHTHISIRMFCNVLNGAWCQNSNKQFKQAHTLKSILWHLVVQIKHRRFVIFGFLKCFEIVYIQVESHAVLYSVCVCVHTVAKHIIVHSKSPLTSVLSRYKSIHPALKCHSKIMFRFYHNPLNQHTPTHQHHWQLGNLTTIQINAL